MGRWDSERRRRGLRRRSVRRVPDAQERRPQTAVPTVAVMRRRRFGKDRLYVRDGLTGERLGWRDERTGDVHVEDEADLARVHAGLKRWQA